ncbi:MAG: acetate uptake transporter [Thermoplasmata archaeon]
MPASAGDMDPARVMEEPPPKGEGKPEWWASPAVVGLMGFGTTTMLAGLSNLPLPYGAGFGNVMGAGPVTGNWTLFGTAIAFGGIAQLIAGFIALRKGNLFAGSAFVGYGSFWLAFTLMLNAWVPATATGVPAFYGLAGFSFIWMMFTFTFLINAPKHGWGLMFVFLFLFIAFILLVVKFWSLASGLTTFDANGSANWAVGGEIIFDGLIAWYVATAELTNSNYGRKVLPV